VEPGDVAPRAQARAKVHPLPGVGAEVILSAILILIIAGSGALLAFTG
jgi:hypothetical protein